MDPPTFNLESGILWALVTPAEAARALGDPREAWLSPPEQKTLDTLQAEGRRREWCAGRLAVKRAVGQWLAEARRRTISPAEVAITQDAHGAPHVQLPAGLTPPHVSIAHTDGYGFAAVVPPEAGVRIGVDTERLRDLSPRFLARLLSPGEAGCATVQPLGVEPLDAVTLWTLKEATVKALGVGLRLPMRCLAVSVLRAGHVEIRRLPVPLAGADPCPHTWSATGVYTRWGELTFAIVTVRGG